MCLLCGEHPHQYTMALGPFLSGYRPRLFPHGRGPLSFCKLRSTISFLQIAICKNRAFFGLLMTGACRLAARSVAVGRRALAIERETARKSDDFTAFPAPKRRPGEREEPHTQRQHGGSGRCRRCWLIATRSFLVALAEDRALRPLSWRVN